MHYRRKINFKTTIVLVIIVVFSSCKSSFKYQKFQYTDIPKSPDYSKESSWAVLPKKYPESLQQYALKNYQDLKADVFYVYPTLLMDKNDKRWNAPINDVEQREKVLNTAVKNQASPFATSGRIYVPFYRQAHIKSYSLYTKGGKEAFQIAYQDVKMAFEYYLKNYNNGRPIIMVGHSQGTNHTTQLLKDFFDDKPLQAKLIAAYIPGMGIKPNEFKTIKPMSKPNQIGGFVSWNTRKKNSYPKKKNVYKGAVTTNPITWNNEKSTGLEQHKGFLYSNGKMYSKALSIEITDGMVWSTNPKFPLRFFMSFLKNYHAGDINLFWQDIKENIELRTRNWLENN